MSICESSNSRTDGLSRRHQGPENTESEHSAAHGVLRMILELNGEEFSGLTQYAIPYERLSGLLMFPSACRPLPLWN
jgi:hypothetical protein